MYFALAENDALLANAQAAKNEEEVEEEDSGYRMSLMDWMGDNGEFESHASAQMNAELRVEDRALRRQSLRHRRRRQQRLEENTASANVADIQVENTAVTTTTSLDVADIQEENTAIAVTTTSANVADIQVENTAIAVTTTTSLDVADIQVENTAIAVTTTSCLSHGCDFPHHTHESTLTRMYRMGIAESTKRENQEDRASLRQRKQRLCLAEGNAVLVEMEAKRELRRHQRRPLLPIKTAAEGLERRRRRRGMDADVDRHLLSLAKWRKFGVLFDPVSSETEVGEELERILFRNLGERSEERLLEYCHRTRANHRISSRFYKRNYGARALKRELEELWEPNGRIPGEPSCWDPNVVSPGVVRGETYAHCFGEKKRKREYFTRPFPPQSSGSSGSDESEPEPPPWTPPLDPSVC